MTYNVLLEDLIGELGGCGRFQWILSCIVHLSKSVATWSMLFMTFAGQDPGFRCNGPANNSVVNGYLDTRNSSDTYGQCTLNNGTETCASYKFASSMTTVVSDFNLVCDRKWIAAMITTIQMAGVLVGCFAAGHVADLVGRKPTFFFSLLVQVIFNAAGYFTTSWEIYAVVRFMIGIGVGFLLTVQFSLTLEFAASTWRPVIVGVPSFPMQAALYALVCWCIPDWRKIHLVIAILGLPFLLTWGIVPESFRWLVTKKRYTAAERVISSIARVNQAKMPDLSGVIETAKQDENKDTDKKYSALDLFRSKESVKNTIGLLFMWFAASYGYYGITFGVKNLSGDLYMNMFLINIVDVPSSFLAIFLVNWFGRKKVCFGFYITSGVAGIAVGILQYIDSPISSQITNILSLIAKLGVSTGWQAMIVFTNELYPTVVRTIAYGVHSTSARVGGMVAPQVVFLNDSIPGLLYFLSGVLMVMSACTILSFRETRGRVLEDTLATVKQENITELYPTEVGNGKNKV